MVEKVRDRGVLEKVTALSVIGAFGSDLAVFGHPFRKTLARALAEMIDAGEKPTIHSVAERLVRTDRVVEMHIQKLRDDLARVGILFNPTSMTLDVSGVLPIEKIVKLPKPQRKKPSPAQKPPPAHPWRVTRLNPKPRPAPKNTTPDRKTSPIARHVIEAPGPLKSAGTALALFITRNAYVKEVVSTDGSPDGVFVLRIEIREGGYIISCNLKNFYLGFASRTDYFSRVIAEALGVPANAIRVSLKDLR